MSSEASANIEIIVNIFREECLKDNVQISSFVLTGEFLKYLAGEPDSSNIREASAVMLKSNDSPKVDNPENILKLACVQKKIMDKYSQTHFCHFNLIPESIEGNNYIPIKSNKFENDEEVFLNSQSEILILFFWAIDDYGCETRMNDYLTIIEKNFEKWKGKVNLFTVIEIEKEEKDEKLKAIEERNWNKFPEIIQHFYIKKENPAVLIYGNESLPEIVVADQKGILRHVGVSYGLNLDEFINEILNGKEIITEEIPKEEEPQSTVEPYIDDQFAEKFAVFGEEAKKLYKEIKSDAAAKKADYDFRFKYQSSYKFTYVMEKASIENLRPTKSRFKISCEKNEFDAFDNLIKKHFTEDEIKNHELEICLIKTSD